MANSGTRIELKRVVHPSGPEKPGRSTPCSPLRRVEPAAGTEWREDLLAVPIVRSLCAPVCAAPGAFLERLFACQVMDVTLGASPYKANVGGSIPSAPITQLHVYAGMERWRAFAGCSACATDESSEIAPPMAGTGRWVASGARLWRCLPRISRNARYRSSQARARVRNGENRICLRELATRRPLVADPKERRLKSDPTFL
jgi:hypothetical protein